MRKCQKFPQSDCAVLHFYQQCMRYAFLPHPHLYFALSFVLLSAPLMCMKWWCLMFDFTVLSTFHGSIDHLQSNIMASSPITSWQIVGKTMETVTDLIFLGSKIVADGDCSHEIKRHLLFGRKAMTNLDSIL